MTVAIGMFQPKDERNIGSLLRSAHLYDVDFTFQIGGTPYRYAATDTSRSTKHIPHRTFDTLRDLRIVWPENQVEYVAVELDHRSEPLSKFQHPTSAVYLLGSENRGLPIEVLLKADRIVQVETPNPWSLNVATTGAIVLHHRYTTTALEAAA